jgi:hypothetical protein
MRKMEKDASESLLTDIADKIIIVRRFRQLPTKWKAIAAIAVAMIAVLAAISYVVSQGSGTGAGNGIVFIVQTGNQTTWFLTITSLGNGDPILKKDVYVVVKDANGTLRIPQENNQHVNLTWNGYPSDSPTLMEANGTHGFNYTSAGGTSSQRLQMGDVFSLARSPAVVDGYDMGSMFFLITSGGTATIVSFMIK